jgi:hypothetical protein
MSAPLRKRGLTMVELVIAMGLLALLMVSVFDLMRSFLSLWDRSETRRALVEEASGVAELMARDLGALENGSRGDVIGEWAFHDTDGDGVQETMWPRLRLVRYATRGELARLQAGREVRRDDEGLIEVCWQVVPAHRGKTEPDLRAEGLILRGERIVDRRATGEVSFFDERFFGTGGVAPPGVLNEVSGDLLWLGLTFATQTSLISESWSIGDGLADVATSWDAWNRSRPDATRHGWNEPGAGMPSSRDRALLPRRVRVELEFERERDRKRRTRLSSAISMADTSLPVAEGGRLPQTIGTYIKIDAEWMRITSISPARAGVVRAERGTRAGGHERGALIHHGETFVREIPIRGYQDDWDL